MPGCRFRAALALVLIVGCGAAQPSAVKDAAIAAGEVVQEDATPDSSAEMLADSATDADGEVPGDAELALPVDATVATFCPGGAHCPCKTKADCDSSTCIPSVNGAHYCAKICNKAEDCDDDEKCSELYSWEVYTCSPRHGLRCEPCTATTGWCPGGWCVAYGDLGSFCADLCNTDTDCGEGFVCKTVTSTYGSTGKACIAVTGDCLCSPRAVSLGLATDCSATGAGCRGIRTCKTVGQPATACAALPGPTTETCNGWDDDCNGKTDEGTTICEDGDPCTVGEACYAGSCLAGKTKYCPNGSLCSGGVCP